MGGDLDREVTKFSRQIAVVAVVLALAPAAIAWLRTPPGSAYLGYQFATDDHMVYAAWMRQGIEGRFLFENRFAVDAQPGLTFHLYFLLLGWLAKGVGIAVAETLARAAFSGLFVLLLGRFVVRLGAGIFASKLAVAFAVFGGGLGFAMWQTFGNAFASPPPAAIQDLTQGLLPADVWQPEGFVFPSMLTNSLFMASLCLLLVALGAFLDARDSWKPVPLGMLAVGMLANVHSYDVLLLGLVLVGLAIAASARKSLTLLWVARGLVIGLGVVPAALWLWHVLRVDPVFQERAATLTFSASFRQVAFGYLPLFALGVVGIALALGRRMAAAAAAFGLLALAGFASPDLNAYWLAWPAFAAALAAAYGASALASGDNQARNLVAAWALVGVVAPYFPALFQRKLAMGLSIPWAILAALGLAAIADRLDRHARNLVATLAILIVGGSSARWWQRETLLARDDVSRTTVHTVYLGPDVRAILDALRNEPAGRKVAVAMPGVPLKVGPDRFASPYVPDLNPILTGLAGVTTYAGHWSETPDYARRRAEVASEVFDARVDPARRRQFLQRIGARYVVAPVPEAFPELPLPRLEGLGAVLVEGRRFKLIRLDPSPTG